MQKLRCHIAGIPHRKPALDLTTIAVGDPVTLEPEPNKFDPNAIKINHPTAGFLGYVPKEETATCRVFGLTSLRIVEIEPTRKWKEVYVSDVMPEAPVAD